MSPVFNMIVRLLFGLALDHQLFCHARRQERCFSEMKPKYQCYNLRPPFDNSFFKYPQPPTEQNIHFKLYTNSNPTTAQILGAQDIDSITNSNFDANGKVTFFTHGFRGNSDRYKPIVEQLLTKVPNVVLVDYEKGARTGYYQATANARVVGAQLATLIETMEQLGVEPGDVHLIGISLGAQVSGYAGEKFQTKKIGRITGLDPAGPNFEGKDDVVKLERTDAAFVDIIHTDITPLSSGVDPGYGCRTTTHHKTGVYGFWIHQHGPHGQSNIAGACESYSVENFQIGDPILSEDLHDLADLEYNKKS